jgi:hypothetical protein
MSRKVTTLLFVIALAGSIVYTAIYLFGLEFASGSVYPEFSSLRTDPMGSRLLYDSLAALPDITVERNYRALEFLPDNAGTVLLLAIPAADFGNDTEPYLRSLEDAARRGNRMVAALTITPTDSLPKFAELKKKWNVTFALDDKTRRHSLYFADANGWSNLYRQGAKLLVIERAFGKGSIVLFAGSSDFTNQSTASADRLGLVTLAIGPNSHVIFDEQHLGIADSGSVMALARRFHLLGFGVGLALCAALLLWRNGVDFPPPVRARAAGRLAGRTSHAGLVTLLRRHIPAKALAATCWQEWLNGNRGKVSPAKQRKAESVMTGAADPVLALREIQAVLHAKGEL